MNCYILKKLNGITLDKVFHNNVNKYIAVLRLCE